MKHHIMVKATPLPSVAGRVDYISNPERQEHLQAVHSTTDDPGFWKALADHCQEQAKHSKTKKACEGREFMVPLANELAAMDPAELARILSEEFYKYTGTENVVAIHWNKSRTNYHAHVVTSENQELDQVKEGTVMTRDTYFDAEGKRSTKSKCCVDGELLPGCSMIKKGERKVEIVKFGPKIAKISSKSFLQEVKQELSELQNALIQEERFKVFERSGFYLSEQHVGKNTTPEQQEAIKAKNALVRDYNAAARELLTQASKNGPEALQEAREELLMWRGDIKPFKLTEQWLKYVQLQIKKIRNSIRKLRDLLLEKEPAEKVSVREKLKSLDDMINSGRERTATRSRQEQTPARKEDLTR